MRNVLKIGGILESDQLSMFSILSAPNLPGIAGKILSVMGDYAVSVEFLTVSVNLDGTANFVCCFCSRYDQNL